MEDKDWVSGYEFDALSGVDAPADWIGGLITVAVLFLAYALVG